ncbi:MAG: T9SS type A sorting domain-containing protein, partial [Bacteroidota bacterium]
LIWERHQGNQPLSSLDVWYPNDIVFLPDSNYMICTNGYDWQLMKINRVTGDTMWTKNFYDTAFSNLYYYLDAMDYAGNSRFIIANNTNNGKIMLVNDVGDTIWTKAKPWQNMQIFRLKKTVDGGFAICGYLYINSFTSLLAFAKLDSLGNTVFTSIFNPVNYMLPLSFYPNPASNDINISPGSMAAEKNLLFTLCDLQGRNLIQQQYDASKPVDVSTLPEGIYIAVLKGKEKEMRGKVVIQR